MGPFQKEHVIMWVIFLFGGFLIVILCMFIPFIEKINEFLPFRFLFFLCILGILVILFLVAKKGIDKV